MIAWLIIHCEKLKYDCAWKEKSNVKKKGQTRKRLIVTAFCCPELSPLLLPACNKKLNSVM